ncbi:MAG: TetR/AcrR family transcriptional regulator [Actinobacteria bacterium]|nr:TetR/AcrR family transcriptional regulator [Actinomycetota bacterium]
MPRAAVAPVLPLPELSAALPPPPAAELDPYLDAAADCFARHGIRRTSVQDVARQLGVNRATVYRQVGTTERMVRLLMARELHELVEFLPTQLKTSDGPEVVVELMATVVEYASGHPVIVKVLNDEPELIGPFLVSDLPQVITRVAAQITPLLKFAMRSGVVAERDARTTAEWLVRTAFTLVLAPPPGDLRAFLAELLLPALSPT